MASISYTDHVFAQRCRNPCLENLYLFLTESIYRNPSKIVCLEFTDTNERPDRHDLDMANLSSLLGFLAVDSCGNNPSLNTNQPQGRILLIEDPTKEVIDALGCQLDIDPLFFASHIHSPIVTAQISKPSIVTLPSEIARQNFLNLHYHRVLVFGDDSTTLRKLYSDDNVQRKVMLLPSMRNTRIGLAQRCCSVLKTSTRQGWLGLILLDAPSKTKYRSLEKEMNLQSELFQGGFEDFLKAPSFSERNTTSINRISLLEDLVFYWNYTRPSFFECHDPSLLAIAFYPSKIVAAEWVRYTEVLSLCIKNYEYSTGTLIGTDALVKLDTDLHALQSWVRRCMQSVHKLQSVINFVELHLGAETNKEAFGLLIKDYEYLISTVKTYRGRLEATVPFVTSLVQMVDSRESLREAANVRRLTNLAMLFVPLSFVTGLLSMNDGVSARGLGVFFTVALPLFVIVLFITHLPNTGLSEFSRRLYRSFFT